MTDAERLLWRHIRDGQLGVKFRRQQPVGNYIVDCVSVENRLIVEVDGGQHAEQQEYDAKRTAFLESEGYRVLRFWNNEVLENIEGVVQMIQSVLALSSPLEGSG